MSADVNDAHFLDAIYAAPHDDALRAVFADRLIEAGNPLGEYIQLQLTRAVSTSSRGASPREKQIFRAHRKTLWPDHPAAKLNDELRHGDTERGFPIELAPSRGWSAVHEQPALATIEGLDVSASRFAADALALIKSPHLRSLIRVRGAPFDIFHELAADSLLMSSLGIALAAMELSAGGPVKPLKRIDSWLRLRHLSVTASSYLLPGNQPDAERVMGLLPDLGPLFLRLESIRLAKVDLTDFGALPLRLMQNASNLAELDMGDEFHGVTVLRKRVGGSGALRLNIRTTPVAAAMVRRNLEELSPSLLLERVGLRVTPHYSDGRVADAERMLEEASRHLPRSLAWQDQGKRTR